MAYMICHGFCVNCNSMMSFNPDLVPSIRVSRKDGKWVADPAGSREPLCKSCVGLLNRKREEQGLPPFPIHPNAYEPEECP